MNLKYNHETREEIKTVKVKLKLHRGRIIVLLKIRHQCQARATYNCMRLFFPGLNLVSLTHTPTQFTLNNTGFVSIFHNFSIFHRENVGAHVITC